MLSSDRNHIAGDGPRRFIPELLATRGESRSCLTNLVYSSYSSDPSTQMND
jgi:hypothetical protein